MFTGSSRIGRRALVRHKVLVALASLAAAASLAIAGAQDAQAHPTTNVPYHQLCLSWGCWDKFSYYDRHTGYTMCEWDFEVPVTVLGFTREYVYWRPIAATYTTRGWEYTYGNWAWAWTSPTEMATRWYQRDGLGNVISIGGDGRIPLYLYAGYTYSVGQQIYYGSNGYMHTEWLTNAAC